MSPLLVGGAVLALVCSVGGYRLGADLKQAEWDRQKLADQQAADAAREVDRLRMRSADATYQTQRAVIAARLTKSYPEAANALHDPICPPWRGAGRSLELGDVPVSRAVLDRLRDSGSDHPAD